MANWNINQRKLWAVGITVLWLCGGCEVPPRQRPATGVSQENSALAASAAEGLLPRPFVGVEASRVGAATATAQSLLADANPDSPASSTRQPVAVPGEIPASISNASTPSLPAETKATSPVGGRNDEASSSNHLVPQPAPAPLRGGGEAQKEILSALQAIAKALQSGQKTNVSEAATKPAEAKEPAAKWWESRGAQASVASAIFAGCGLICTLIQLWGMSVQVKVLKKQQALMEKRALLDSLRSQFETIYRNDRVPIREQSPDADAFTRLIQCAEENGDTVLVALIQRWKACEKEYQDLLKEQPPKPSKE